MLNRVKVILPIHGQFCLLGFAPKGFPGQSSHSSCLPKDVRPMSYAQATLVTLRKPKIHRKTSLLTMVHLDLRPSSRPGIRRQYRCSTRDVPKPDGRDPSLIRCGTVNLSRRDKADSVESERWIESSHFHRFCNPSKASEQEWIRS